MTKKKNTKPDERFERVQQYVKNGKGQEVLISKSVPVHLLEKKGFAARHGLIRESDQEFISQEQIDREKKEYFDWAKGVNDVDILKGLLGMEKLGYKQDIIKARIEELKKKETK